MSTVAESTVEAEDESSTNLTIMTSKKRKHPPAEDTPAKKPKLNKLELSKSPLQYLNTILSTVPVFTTEHVDGPTHDPLFCAVVEVGGRVFQGFGKSKQHAKQVTALEVLKVILENPTLTYDAADKFPVERPIEQPEAPPPPEPTPLPIKLDDNSKTPLQLLNEIEPNATFDLIQEDSAVTSRRFVIDVTIKGVRYRGFGPNKKKAKHAAARTALSAMITPIQRTDSLVEDTLASVSTILSDTITQAVLEKYESIIATRPEKKPWKVLAGLVATFGMSGTPAVLCITTGTKCISGQYLSMSGNAIFDCHGEILTRRCFKYICYQELLRLKQAVDNRTNAVQSSAPLLLELDPTLGKARLAEGVRLHLFISTAPCGDGRLFAPNENACKSVDEGAKKLSRGLLRTKIEGGEGTVRIHGDTVVQTWDGILNGDQRLLTHACSDKMLRWNVLGLQGSLLSKFVSPIYLSSVVLGSLYHPEHLSRALVERVASVQQNPSLPASYRLNRPVLSRASSTLERHITKSPWYGLNWILGDQTPEILNAVTGVQENGHPSRLSKKMLFEWYASVAQTWSPNGQMEKLTYSEAKKSALEYQTAKQCLLHEIKSTSLGLWIKKPEECETFL